MPREKSTGIADNASTACRDHCKRTSTSSLQAHLNRVKCVPKNHEHGARLEARDMRRLSKTTNTSKIKRLQARLIIASAPEPREMRSGETRTRIRTQMRIARPIRKH
jgi:hypothetical protein